MNKQLLRYLQFSLLLLDTVVLNCVVIMSKAWLVTPVHEQDSESYFHFLIYSNVSWFILSWMGGLYSQSHISAFESFSRRTSRIYLVWVCTLMIYLFFYRQFDLSRLFLVSSLGIFGLALLLNRFAYLGIRGFYKNKKHLSKRVIILGYNSIARKLVSYLERESINTRVVGFLEEHENVNELTHYPVLNSIDHTLEISREMQVNEIISTITPEQNNKIYELMHQAESECIRFKIIPDFSLFIRKQVHIEYFNDMPVMSLRKEPLEDIGNRIQKRGLDILVSIFVMLFILTWLVPIISLLIWCESKGSVFFGQLRSGKNNKNFRCWKFRSMKENLDADKLQAQKEDSRLTTIGKFIRKTSLDEFPQFFNVLKGEMSLVGPRPHMLKHTSDYAKLVDQYMVRQFLKPGITGWAQINGFRGEIHGNEQIIGRVSCDIWYSENWSFWLDLKILFLTVYKVITGDKQAY